MDILYEIVLALQRGLDDFVCNHLNLPKQQIDLSDWEQLIHTIKNLNKSVTIGLVGKYIQLHDAYLSVHEALKHAGYAHQTNVEIRWIDAGAVNPDNVSELLDMVDGVLVPGGFGDRGIEGKICAIQYARENNIPFFGICLGMQLATIEFARNVAHLKDANSTEFDEQTPHPVIDYLPDQYKGIHIGGTLRLGEYECELASGSKAYQAYGQSNIRERHRHRYELNNQYKQTLKLAGLIISGRNPQTDLVEVIELKDHPWFVACQFHPEFTSRPMRPNPLFHDFIGAAISYDKAQKN